MVAKKMTVVYIKLTGNIVGALTRRGNPGAKLDPADYLAQGLLLRDPTNLAARLTVAADDLAVKVADLLDDTLANPQAYYIDETDNVKPSAAASTISITTPTVNPTPAPWKVNLLPTKQAIWIEMQSIPDGRVFTESVEAPDSGAADDVPVDIRVTPGTYKAVVFVTGVAPTYYAALSVP